MTTDIARVACRFGSETFDVYADWRIAKLFEREFPDPRSDRSPSVVFRIHRTDCVPSVDSEVTESLGPQASHTQSHVSFSNRRCTFEMEFSHPLEVDVHLLRTKKMAIVHALPSWMQRMMTRKFVTADEQEYGYLIYSAVLWVLFLSGLRSSRLFLHASGFARRNSRVLLCGTGGVGKTSLSKYLLSLPDAKFLSDDIVTVSADGKVYANSMFIHWYPYNEGGRIRVGRHGYGGPQVLERMHWLARRSLFGPKGVCRRVSPFHVHGCDVAEAGGLPLTDIIWLDRDGTDRATLSEVDVREFAEAHLEVLRGELKSAFSFYTSAKSRGWAPLQAGLPIELADRVFELLAELAGNVRLRRFNVAEGRSAEYNAAQLLRGIDG